MAQSEQSRAIKIMCNVGIGTTAPATVLDVKGKANFTGNFSIVQTSNILFVDNTSGNVGIGTTGPNFLLDVAGKGNVTGIITNEASGAITTCNAGEIRGNATANKICLCTTANNWKCAAVS